MNFNPDIPYYNSNIFEPIPLGTVPLWTLIHKIKQPSDKMLNILNGIRQADKEGNQSLKNELKTHLVSFTPSVMCSRRRYDDIKYFTGLVTTDNDKLSNQSEAEELRDYIFHNHSQVIASWLSSSRRGVRSLIRIPVCTSVQQFKSYYNAIYNTFRIYKNLDKATQNPVLPMFYSDDPDIRYRKDFTIWTDTYTDPQPKPKIRPIVIYDMDNKGKVLKILKNKIDAIYDNGHPQLRAVCYSLGGYVASGYISEMEALDYVENMIRHNSYLGVAKKVNTYLRTAQTMIRKGQTQPLSL